MTTDSSEAARIVERERASWSNAAAGWRTYDRWITGMFNPVSEEMFPRLGLRPGMRVLDLASGTGEPSLSIAEKVGPAGQVVGIDLAEPMLEFAREKGRQRGLTNVEFRVANIEAADLPDAQFDAASMRFGIMFVPDPVAALRKVHRALRPGGRVVLATWAAPSENPMLRLPLEVLRRYVEVPTPPPDGPGLFAFADPQRIVSTLTSAGFREVDTAPLRLRLTGFPSGKEYWEFIRGTAGPVARLYGPLPPEARARLDGEIEAEASKFAGTSGLDMPAMAWIAWGTR